MALTPDELASWRFLTDDQPAPEEFDPPGDKLVAIRIFFCPPSDNRFPSHLSMPKLLRSAPQRIKDEWTRSLVAELSGVCPNCRAERGELPTIRHRNCSLAGFGRRARGWLVPGSIDAINAVLSPPDRPLGEREEEEPS